jgi:hypothetical protein
MPTMSKTPLPLSTTEWMPSDNMAELPVTPAAASFVTAMAKFAAIAATTAFLELSPADIGLPSCTRAHSRRMLKRILAHL